MPCIDVCFASDDNYAPFMGVAILSVLTNAAKTDYLRFHILDNGISEANKKALASLKGQYPKYEIAYYPVEGVWLKDLPLINTHLSLATYARLFLGRVLPEEVSRLIYLDSDILVRASLAELFNQNLEDCILGGVVDLGIMKEAKCGRHPWSWREELYINAGVLLIDMERWRTEGVEEKLLQYVAQPAYPLKFEDQDVINFALRGRIKILNPCWNGMVVWDESRLDGWPNIKELRQVLKNCPVVHFASSSKPWINWSGWDTNTQQYQQVMQDSPWKDKQKVIPVAKIFRSFCRYAWIHPACFVKLSFYRDFFKKGVLLFR